MSAARTPEHPPGDAVAVSALTHRYGDRKALDAISFCAARGEVFGLVGPNGGGKTTAFRVISTLIVPQEGSVRVLGRDVRTETAAVRASIGVVFQAPSLDRKLTVLENLHHQGHLHGLRGAVLRERADAMLRRFGLEGRARDLVETLSGGMRRRLELAKGCLHRPRLLLLDEASAGLDPIARRELADLLRDLSVQDGVTVVLTTHLMEEAERCDRVGILAEGRFVAIGAPDALRSEIGGDVIVLTSPDPRSLAEAIRERFGRQADEVPGGVRLEHERGGTFVAELFEALRGRIDSVTLSRPTLEDVFFRKTGHAFRQDEAVG